MKIQGKELKATNIVSIVLPRSDGDIVLKAAGVTSFKEFTDVCPLPVPPVMKKPDGSEIMDISDKDYREAINNYASLKSAWMILKSLSVTPGLEWETVDLENPETWVNYADELENAGFTEYEMARIIEGVTSANGVNQRAIDEAEKRFLAGQGQEQ